MAEITPAERARLATAMSPLRWFLKGVMSRRHSLAWMIDEATRLDALDVPEIAQREAVRRDADRAAVEAARAFAARSRHRDYCEQWRVLGDPMGYVSGGDGGVRTTARPWTCCCGLDGLRAALAAATPPADGTEGQ